MGPVENSLRSGTRRRRNHYRWIWCSMSTKSFRAVQDACRALGFDTLLDAQNAGCIPDVLSEAIEAAEALGL